MLILATLGYGSILLLLIYAYPHTNLSFTGLIIVAILWFCNVIVGFISPAFIGIMLLFTHTTFSVYEILQKFLNNIRPEEIDWIIVTSRQKNMKQILKLGNDIIDIFPVLERAFGKFLFIQIGISLIRFVLGIFFSSSLFRAFRQPQLVYTLSFIVALNQACVAIGVFFILFALIYMGQIMLVKLRKARKHLAALYINQYDLMEDKDKAMIQELMYNVGNISPIRPLDSFDLNMTTGLSVGGVLITYIVVLMQFKINEQ
jgi:hypothetical protein